MESLKIDAPKNEAPKNSINIWIDKIKAIKTIKGYEIKNGEILYDVDVWDKNGQTLFVPPLQTEAVRKFDTPKLATFLQDCLIRGSTQGVNSK